MLCPVRGTSRQVLLGKLFFRVNCGLLTVGKKVADTKIEVR